MTPEAERQALSVSGYVRRKPVDPYAEIRERTHDKLREEVALMDMDREIARIVRRDWINVSKEAR